MTTPLSTTTPTEGAPEMTHDEQVELARHVMAEGPARDLEAGLKWQASQRQVVIIERKDQS